MAEIGRFLGISFDVAETAIGFFHRIEHVIHGAVQHRGVHFDGLQELIGAVLIPFDLFQRIEDLVKLSDDEIALQLRFIQIVCTIWAGQSGTTAALKILVDRGDCRVS